MALRDLFYIRRSDRIAIIFLIAIVLIIAAATYFGGNGRQSLVAQNDTLATDSNRYRQYYNGQGRGRSNDTYYYYTPDERQQQLFPFDPNTADSTQLLSLGLAPWQVRSIYRYRAKGGVFRSPEDFSRVYGLTQGQYNRLAPYIRISADYRPAAAMFPRDSAAGYERDTLLFPVKIRPGETVDINAADTNSLKTVPGIGSGFSRAIVGYRERLGGFCSLDQLREIRNFPEGSMPYLRLDSCRLRKLNINRLTLNELKRHPYIGFYRAKAITDYRRLHGDIHSLSELSLHRDFTPEAIDRLEPYVEY